MSARGCTGLDSSSALNWWYHTFVDGPLCSQLIPSPPILPLTTPEMSEIRRKLVIVGDGACGKVPLVVFSVVDAPR